MDPLVRFTLEKMGHHNWTNDNSKLPIIHFCKTTINSPTSKSPNVLIPSQCSCCDQTNKEQDEAIKEILQTELGFSKESIEESSTQQYPSAIYATYHILKKLKYRGNDDVIRQKLGLVDMFNGVDIFTVLAEMKHKITKPVDAVQVEKVRRANVIKEDDEANELTEKTLNLKPLRKGAFSRNRRVH